MGRKLMDMVCYEDNLASYAYGSSTYKLIWLLLIGSLLGYVIEMLWYHHLRGKWINRKGVIYEPYSPIYGIAMAGFVYLFYKLRKKGIWFLFLLGSVVGSLFEYICGYLQEKVLGTKSWDYSGKHFQIHGRICLEFALYWGLIAVAIMKIIYPICSCLIENLPPSFGKQAGVLLFVLFCLDCMISMLACIRQKRRRQGKEANNSLARFLDRRYSDEYLSGIYTEIRIVH